MFGFKNYSKKELKEELNEAYIKITELNSKLKDFEKENKFLKDANRDLRHDIEEEHLENYNQHRALLNIKKLIEKTAGETFKSMSDLKKDINKELSTIFKQQIVLIK